ncbi:OsmC family protein [Alicyclobacillus ferrooxydans]|uniref:Osmotically inducible protein C n=1 Tax=Alicyclobacillus ferrooxydans TaxID=471514 RepID=A0A0P9D4C2_9BACL|nr:OsmC family protein [Alicyclobacillus ferrooxydans]KPV44327.1 hypothetical protein AN477_07735 [Alicyclobacillus ferrooxydans]
MAELSIAIRAKGTGKRTDVTTKGHSFTIDEPTSMGGTNVGASPLEYLLGALAGCEEVIAQGVAKKLDFELHGIEFDVEGVLDPRGLAGEPGIQPYFQKVTTIARVQTCETPERILQLREAVEKQCPVFTLIEAAGVEIESRWEKKSFINMMSQGMACDVDGNC